DPSSTCSSNFDCCPVGTVNTFCTVGHCCNTAGVSCSDSSQCCTGTTCGAFGSCCKAPDPSSTCSSNFDCCPVGTVNTFCTGGHCCNAAGISCSDSSQCCTGLTCSGGVCA